MSTKALKVVTSTTEERLVVDIVAPGYNAVNVRAVDAPDIGKREVIVKIGKPKVNGAKLAYQKETEVNIKEVIPVPRQFDLDQISWTMSDGVLRISIPKTDQAKGREVPPAEATAPVENAG